MDPLKFGSFVGAKSAGTVDCDKSPDLAKWVPILNVPSVAYYAQGKLMVVIVGTTQDAHVRLERILSGEFIGHDDSLGEL
jgi:hypothetical protein